jgi:hypothetical protein
MEKDQLKKQAYWLERVTLELYHYYFFDQSKSSVVDHLYTIYRCVLDFKENLPNISKTIALQQYEHLEKGYFYAFTLI